MVNYTMKTLLRRVKLKRLKYLEKCIIDRNYIKIINSPWDTSPPAIALWDNAWDCVEKRNKLKRKLAI